MNENICRKSATEFRDLHNLIYFQFGHYLFCISCSFFVDLERFRITSLLQYRRIGLIFFANYDFLDEFHNKSPLHLKTYSTHNFPIQTLEKNGTRIVRPPVVPTKKSLYQLEITNGNPRNERRSLVMLLSWRVLKFLITIFCTEHDFCTVTLLLTIRETRNGV